MKKLFIIAVLAFTATSVSFAQRAAEYDLGKSSGENVGYNRIGLSFNNTTFSSNSDAEDIFDGSISTNGFGIDYIHGFSLSSSMPMFIETGANLNFNFGSKGYEGSKLLVQNFNLQIPVNYVYRFTLADNFSLAPYVGLNFKLNLATRFKETLEDGYIWDNGSEEDSDWESAFDKDTMGNDGTWNRFQMGWHIGVGVQYSKLHLGLQYGTDFISAYSHSFDGYKPAINTGNLKLTLSYCF